MSRRKIKDVRLSHEENYQNFKKERVRDGDYVYAPHMEGVYFVSPIETARQSTY